MSLDLQRESSARTILDSSPWTSPTSIRVALVNMPFAMADRPSIQCGLLKSALIQAGHQADVFYFNLELAAEIGGSLYNSLAQLRTDLLLGEWLFSVGAFGHRSDEQSYRKACPSLDEICQQHDFDFDRFCELRNNVFPAWIEQWAEKVDWSEYTLIGFTSTFEQNTASFSLARAIKQRHPDVTIVFGGANFDGTMGKEYVRVLPFIDYAVIGEGDRALPQLARSLACGKSPLGIPGVVGRLEDKLVDSGPASPVHDLDTIPDPNYDEFFGTLFRLGREKVLERKSPVLLIETARGCWWGAKQHCTFCGLNNNGMSFRSKSPDEAARQLQALAAKYQIVNFEAVDNIMDYSYLDRLCGPLTEKHYDYRIFYEVKANLSRAQLQKMARAGIRSIQPGIESLSSHILSLMRKGITMLRNVRLLKWAYYYGMRVGWNILTGFPGETEEDYAEQLRVISLIRHLPPPSGCGRIWLERFSPYYFDRSFPVRNVRPLDVYRHIYPQELNLDEIAYFFHYEMDNVLPEEAHEQLGREIDAWKDAWRKKPVPALLYQRAPEWIQVIDRRTPALAAHAFHGREAEIYELCSETDRTVNLILQDLSKTEGPPVSLEDIRESLDKFCSLGLMLQEKDRFLSLALPANPHW